jgi:hypothetical protein
MRRVSPIPVFPVGKLMDDPVAMSLIDVYRITVNLAGLVGAGRDVGGGTVPGIAGGGEAVRGGNGDQGGRSVDVRERREIRAVGGGIGIEHLSGPEAELAVEEGAADLEQEIGTTAKPSHPLRLVHDDEGTG